MKKGIIPARKKAPPGGVPDGARVFVFNKPSTVLAAIDYLHHNPVRWGFMKRAVAWKCSSARYYLLDPLQQYTGLPTVHSLPAEWLNESD
jgi:hypothetical protein